MADLAHRLAPHDELVARARGAGYAGERMPNFGYLCGFTKHQAQAINDAYDQGRRAFLGQRARSRP
jgi:hypothetical protein